MGAGPTGLTLANDLLSRGIKFKIIDQAAGPEPNSRAMLVHARTLEHLANLGFAESFIENGLAVRGSSIYSRDKRIVHLDFDEMDSPYKFVLAIPQNITEQLLSDNLNCVDIKIERNCRLVGFTQNNNSSVTAVLRRTIGGGTDQAVDQFEEYEQSCKYLVGCDGADSNVRLAMGVDFEGAAYADSFGVADVSIAGDLAADEMHTFFSEDGALTFVPFGQDRWRILFEADDANKIKGDEKLDFKTVSEVVGRRCKKALQITKPTWLTWFKAHRLCASSYQNGRVFLAGDAGHIHSPIGGVGMNAGIQDAINIGWKLAVACRGLANANLLSTYNEERHNVGMALLKGTDLATKVVTLKSPVGKSVRNSLMTFMSAHEIVQQRILKAGGLTGISYRKMSLSQESHRPQVEAIGRSLFPLPFKKVTNEMPGLSSWMDFTDAPAAGDLAPDAELDDNGFRLSHHIGSPRFKLLLFDGYEPSEQGYQHMFDLEYKLASRFCDWIDIYIVVPFGEGSRSLRNYASVIYDDSRYLHEYYGASSECLYLIRPDGYIGFRCQPASYEKLEKYLLLIFKSSLIQHPRSAGS